MCQFTYALLICYYITLQEHHLRALQYLPDILKLQRQLSEKFHRRLDRDEADKYTLGNLLKRGHYFLLFLSLLSQLLYATLIFSGLLHTRSLFSCIRIIIAISGRYVNVIFLPCDPRHTLALSFQGLN